MPQYVLNRNYLHRSLLGHTIRFDKGQPVHVPPECEREVAAFGAERVDGPAIDLIDPEKPPVRELSLDERKEEIFAAFDLIAEKNDSKEFTAQGVPTVKAVERITGFDVDKSEVLEGWSEWKIAKAAEQ
jgi:hypothetical protein